MRILVTGATGYIGAHVVKALALRGHEVHATDYNTNQNDLSEYVKTENFIPIDIRNDFGKCGKVDKVIHIAAKTKVPASVKDPWNYYRTNVLGTKHVIDGWDHDHFIYCSTGSAFEPGSNPYAATKWGGELITKQFCSKHSIVRFYNVSGNEGMHKFDDDVSHLIRKAAKVANKNNNHPIMPIYGTDYNTRDGTCIRNYTHITDIVNSLVRIAENAPTGAIDCLGAPEGISVREVIQCMKHVSGVNFRVEELDRREGDVAISTVPTKSKYFKQTKTLLHMCKDALRSEL